MSVYAVQRVRQIMDIHINKALEQLVMASEKCQQIEHWLCDQASRDAYQRELVFMTLRPLLFNDRLAVELAGNISQRVWENALQKAEEMLTAGEIPPIKYPPSPEWMIPYINASNYIFDQYAYGDKVCPKPGDTFLDCGAFAGETALWALKKGVQEVYAFEPNPDTIPYLRHNMNLYDDRQQVRVIETALADKKGSLRMDFASNNPGGARLLENASGPLVPVTTIDDWCRENSITPNFIKMDMEGAEPAALAGAANVIARHRPQLAISLYHSLYDMYTIPFIIKHLCPDYKFWCKKNAIYVEFILYASV